MTTDWDPSNHRDTYRDRVLELIEAKRAGEEIVTRTEEPEGAEAVDLMAELQQSVEAGRGRRPGDAHQAEPIARRGHDGGDVTTVSKSEPYEVAEEYDVAGRSSMSKDELVDAIRSVRSGSRRAS